MTFERWGYKFDGLFSSPDSLHPIEGVYVIFCKIGDDLSVLDVGESDDVQDRVSNHDRADCWKQNCIGTIYYSATYTPFSEDDERREIEQIIRDSEENIPCGEH